MIRFILIILISFNYSDAFFKCPQPYNSSLNFNAFVGEWNIYQVFIVAEPRFAKKTDDYCQSYTFIKADSWKNRMELIIKYKKSFNETTTEIIDVYNTNITGDWTFKEEDTKKFIADVRMVVTNTTVYAAFALCEKSYFQTAYIMKRKGKTLSEEQMDEIEASLENKLSHNPYLRSLRSMNEDC